MFIDILRVADAANTLPTAMADLARMLRRMDNLRGRIGAALIYPAILIVAAVGLIALIALYLAPTLAPTFEAVNKPLPGTLGALLWLGETLTAGGGRFSGSKLPRPSISRRGRKPASRCAGARRF